METNKFNISRTFFIMLSGLMMCAGTVLFVACDDDDSFPETRLFRPVLSEDLRAEGNSIIVNMGKLKRAVSYTLEISRDTFKTIDYTLETEDNYLVIDTDLLGGDPLFWNTLYQLRATAHAADPEYDSRASDLGSVKTERFPTIMNLPASYDVIDIAARVSWTVAGATVTKIKLFASTDLKLTTPLAEYDVPVEDQEDGDTFIDGLDPSTEYQVAIYSEETLRGWADYATLEPDIDPSSPGVVDITADEDPQAVINAVAGAADGAIILVKRGVLFDMPTDPITQSVTIRAAYGFGKQKARLYTTGNWNIAGGSTIDHIRFIDIELRGKVYDDANGCYVFNPSANDVNVNEVSFTNCEIGTLRGIMRIRGTNVNINNFNIVNCVVDSIGGYGLFTTDTNPNASNPTATVNNIVFRNSTFNKVRAGITSRNNSQSILIEGCTFDNFILGGSGNYIFRYRGGAGFIDVINGIVIHDCIFGPGWDEGNANVFDIRGFEGLPATPLEIINQYSTSEFLFQTGRELTGFAVANYSGTHKDLWVSPDNNNFNFKDPGFAGRYDAGDPRWRIKL